MNDRRIIASHFYNFYVQPTHPHFKPCLPTRNPSSTSVDGWCWSAIASLGESLRAVRQPSAAASAEQSRLWAVVATFPSPLSHTRRADRVPWSVTGRRSSAAARMDPEGHGNFSQIPKEAIWCVRYAEICGGCPFRDHRVLGWNGATVKTWYSGTGQFS